MNQLLLRFRKHRFPAPNILLIAPRCLHRSACGLPVEDELQRCARCGQCQVKDLVELSRQYGLRCVISRGGREAAVLAKDPAIKGVIAVACLKELAQGILAVFPKPVMAVVNCRPHGACKDTWVNMAAVRRAVAEMVVLA